MNRSLSFFCLMLAATRLALIGATTIVTPGPVGRPTGAGPSSLLTGLVGYWKLNEASGSRADSSASGITLTDNNTVTSSSGKVGNAATFTAANSEYLNNVSAGALCSSTAFTVVLWVKPNSPAGESGLAGVENSNSWELIYKDSNRFRFQHQGQSDFQDWSVGGGITNGTYYMVAVAFDSTADLSYMSVNGVNWVSEADTSVKNLSATAFVLGRNAATAANYFNGDIDEVGVWDRVLTNDELNTLHGPGGVGTTHPF